MMVTGCLGASDEPIATTQQGAEGGRAPGFELNGTNCREGGGHSVHPRMFNDVPDPWVRADVLEDVGPQLVYSEVPDPLSPVPSEGNTWGNYHATVLCEIWTFNGVDKPGLVLGFVGAKVEPPAFDTGPPAQRHYLVAVVGTSDAEVNEALQAAGLEGEELTGLAADENGLFHTLLTTHHHGEYETLFVPEDLGTTEPWTKRIWWLEGNDDEGYVPFALDLTDTAAVHRVAQVQGYFGHWGTDMHGPQGGLSGHTAALLYEDFDRTVTLGPRPDVVLSERYHHG